MPSLVGSEMCIRDRNNSDEGQDQRHCAKIHYPVPPKRYYSTICLLRNPPPVVSIPQLRLPKLFIGLITRALYYIIHSVKKSFQAIACHTISLLLIAF